MDCVFELGLGEDLNESVLSVDEIRPSSERHSILSATMLHTHRQT
jgi:hypothetical protein